MKKRFLALPLSILVLSLLAGCGASKEAETTAAAAAETTKAAAVDATAPIETAAPADASVEYEDTVYLSYMGDINSADPYFTASSAKLMTTNCTFRTLTWFNYATRELDGVLMESWEYNDDFTQLTGKLREGVKFHDGTEFTAEDVEFTWNFCKDVQNVKNPIPNADKMVSEVEIIDDYTVCFHLNSPMPDFADYLQIQMYSKEAWDSLPAEEAGVIGCGPYKWAGREAGVSWTIERFDDYYGGIDNYPTKKFVFKVISEESTRATALESGEIDVNLEVAAASASTLQANSDVVVDIQPGASGYFVGFNWRRDKWTNPEARKAVAKAVDKEALVAIAFEGGVGGGVNNNFVVPSALGYSEDVTPITYDPAAAKAEWDALGLGDSLKILTYTARKSQAETIQASLQQNLGVNVEVEIVESANFNAILNEGNFDIFINYCPYTGALLYQLDRYHSAGGAQNQYGYDGVGYTEMANYVRAGEGYEDMLARFVELQQWLADECILYPTVIGNQICAYRSDVEGFTNAVTASLIEVSTVRIPKR